MKIAFVSDAIWPYNKGGKEKRLFEISTRLAARGHDVHIYTMQWWNLLSSSKQKVASIKPAKQVRKEHGVTLHGISPLYPLYSGERRSMKEALLFSLHCFRLLTADFDVVDVDSMPYFPLFVMKIVTMLKRKPMIATWHEVWSLSYWKSYLGWKGMVAFHLEKFSASLPTAIFSASKTTSLNIRRTYNSRKNVITVTSGIDSTEIASIPISKQKSDILYIGRLLVHKHVDQLIEAMAILVKTHPKIQCIIVGEGPERSRLQARIRKWSLESNVTLLGRVEKHEEVYALMKASKVFALPSTREGFGLVVLEANACGLPVVVTNTKDNAAKDLITEGENGYLVSSSPESFAEGLERALKENRKPNVPEQYDWNKIIPRIEREYLRLRTG